MGQRHSKGPEQIRRLLRDLRKKRQNVVFTESHQMKILKLLLDGSLSKIRPAIKGAYLFLKGKI
jgi:hypothetical protein